MLDDFGLHELGGVGPPIVLLHGLMGSAATWTTHVPWFRRFGRVYGLDALGHGRAGPDPIATETFVADIAEHLDQLPPAVIVGHSMGGLHGLCYAAAHPERVTALVVEDICVDWRGGTNEPWLAVMRDWPEVFADEAAVTQYFGPIAGEYFARSFRRDPDGLRLHGDLDTFSQICLEWRDRDFWREWEAVRCPSLLLEGEHGVTLPGQMREMCDRNPNARYHFVAGAAHLIHDEQPDLYYRLVQEFLGGPSSGS